MDAKAHQEAKRRSTMGISSSLHAISRLDDLKSRQVPQSLKLAGQYGVAHGLTATLFGTTGPGRG